MRHRRRCANPYEARSVTLQLAALAIDTGIPITVLLSEPDNYLQAMFEVMDRRHEARKYGADSKRWDEE